MLPIRLNLPKLTQFLSVLICWRITHSKTRFGIRDSLGLHTFVAENRVIVIAKRRKFGQLHKTSEWGKKYFLTSIFFSNYNSVCGKDKKLLYVNKDAKWIHFIFVNLTICMNRVVFRIQTQLSVFFNVLSWASTT